MREKSQYTLSNLISYTSNKFPSSEDISVYRFQAKCSLLGRCTVDFKSVLLNIDHQTLPQNLKRKFITGGKYERAEVGLLKDHLRSEVDVIELGAGVGYVSTWIDRHLADGSHQISVEANEYVLPMLRDTKTLNEGDFEIVHAAYSYNAESVLFHVTTNYFSSSSMDREGRDHMGTLEVPAVDLESLRQQSGIGRFQLVADIEGSEFDLIENELDLLAKYCERLFIEFHDHTSRDIEEGIQQLENAGFQIIDTDADVYVLG